MREPIVIELPTLPSVSRQACSRRVSAAWLPVVSFGASVALHWMVLASTAQALAGEVTTVAAHTTINIEVSGGQLLRLPEGAGSEFIADPTIADIQAPKPSSIFVFGKKPGRTTLFVLSPDGTPLNAYVIDVRFPQAELDSQVRSGGGASSVRLRYTANGAVLNGLVPDAETAERVEQTAKLTVGSGVPLSNQLRVAGSPQVNLRVRVSEVSRAVSRELGSNWSALLSDGAITAGKLASTSSGVGSILGSLGPGSADVSKFFDALATEGLATILAEPNLTATSGSSAKFLAGGEIPIPIPQALGTTSVEYKQFGVGLAFTPTVLSSGHINVKVSAEVSALDGANAVQLNGGELPALTTRRAETTLDLASGQSFAIAGLIQNDNSNNVRKLPWLGDIPVLGALFRSSHFQRNESELVIVVTAYVVRPSSGAVASNPASSVRMPSDVEQLVFGQAGMSPRRTERRAPSVKPVEQSR
jgi:pilus assembly protein CpaC